MLCSFAVMTCKELSKEISFGGVMGDVYTYNAEVKYRCNEGYYITKEPQTVKSRVLKCQSNGTWKGEVPTCSSK